MDTNKGRIIGKITKICKICSAPYKIYPVREKESRFCSRGCFHRWQKGPEFKEKQQAKRKRVTKTCEGCGKPYWVHYHRRNEARFCCHKCYKGWLTDSPEGRALIKKTHAKRKPMSDEQKLAISKSTKKRMQDPSKRAAAMAPVFKYLETHAGYSATATEGQKWDNGWTKDWKLVAPSGKIIRVRNLAKWSKENQHLFEDSAPASKHPQWARIMRGLQGSHRTGYCYNGWLCMAKRANKVERDKIGEHGAEQAGLVG
jgi:protein-arginine kinase activator protein McsA